jgi:hypothetical protein
MAVKTAEITTIYGKIRVMALILESKDVAFSTITMKMWILDSGANCHYCQSLEWLTEVR